MRLSPINAIIYSGNTVFHSLPADVSYSTRFPRHCIGGAYSYDYKFGAAESLGQGQVKWVLGSRKGLHSVMICIAQCGVLIMLF